MDETLYIWRTIAYRYAKSSKSIVQKYYGRAIPFLDTRHHDQHMSDTKDIFRTIQQRQFVQLKNYYDTKGQKPTCSMWILPRYILMSCLYTPWWLLGNLAWSNFKHVVVRQSWRSRRCQGCFLCSPNQTTHRVQQYLKKEKSRRVRLNLDHN